MYSITEHSCLTLQIRTLSLGLVHPSVHQGVAVIKMLGKSRSTFLSWPVQRLSLFNTSCFLLLFPFAPYESFAHSLMGACRYCFDRVFEKTATQEQVFENTALPLLPGLLDGFNATVFAYGVSVCLAAASSARFDHFFPFCLGDRLRENTYHQRAVRRRHLGRPF